MYVGPFLADKVYRKALAKLIAKTKDENGNLPPSKNIQLDVITDFVYWYLTDEGDFGQMTMPENDLKLFTEKLAEKLEVDSPYQKQPLKLPSMYIVLIGDRYLSLEGVGAGEEGMSNLVIHKQNASTFPTEAIAFLHASIWFLTYPQVAEKLVNKTILVIQS